MTNSSLARSYLLKAINRLDILEMLRRKKAYSDVVREAQKIVELALKAMLRQVGIEPPRWHDVDSLVVERKDRFPQSVRENANQLARVSKWLRKERELSFYEDVGFIPTEECTLEGADRGVDGAQFAVNMAEPVIRSVDNSLLPEAEG